MFLFEYYFLLSGAANDPVQFPTTILSFAT